MREFLTFVSGLLVLVLSAALVGPYFVDWDAQRGRIEALLSESSGFQVAIGGSINVALLPTPRIDLENVEIGSPGPGEPRLGLGRAIIELNLGPLFRGTLALGDVTLEEPILRLTLGADGSLAIPSLPRPLRTDIGFDHLSIKQGHMSLEDPARNRLMVLDGIDLDAQGDSLTGPFKATGSLRLPNGDAAVLRLSTAALEGTRLRTKLVLDAGSGLRSELDGTVIFSAGAGVAARVAFDGAVVLVNTLDRDNIKLPWRLSGPLKLDAFGASMYNLELRIGDDERATSLNGDAQLAFSSIPSGRINLSARQLDFDRLFASQPSANGPTSSPARLVQLLQGLLTGKAGASAEMASDTHIYMSVSVATPLLILGGETLTDAKLALTQKPGLPSSLSFESTGPAATRVAASGTLSRDAAPVFQGTASLSSRDLVRWRNWLAQGLPQVAYRLAVIPFRVLDAKGDLRISAANFNVKNLSLESDRSSFFGDADFTAATSGKPGEPGTRAHLAATLSGEALDLDALPDLTDIDKAIPDLDFNLAMEARTIRAARLTGLPGNSNVEAGHVTLRVSNDAKGWKLDQLNIANLGGASLSASGVAANGVAVFDAQVAASGLTDLAAILQRLTPPRPTVNASEGLWPTIIRAFAQRAPTLAPANLDFHARAERKSPAGWNLLEGSLTGTAGGTMVRGQAVPDPATPGDINLALTLNAPETPILLRQLGFPSLPLKALGPGHANMQLHGNLSKPVLTRIDAQLAGSHFDFEGVSALAEGPNFSGSVRLSSPDVLPLLQAFSIFLPDGTGQKLALSLSAQARGTSRDLALNDLAGAFNGGSMTGNIKLTPGDGTTRANVTGALRFDQMSLPALLALGLGPQSAPRAEATWSDAAFGVGLADPPDAALQIRSRRILLMDGWSAETATFRLETSSGELRISDFTSKFASGTLGGRLQVRRDAASALLSASLNLDGVVLNSPDITGRISGQLDATASGNNAQALMGNLAGGGRLTITDFAISHAAPKALANLVASPEAASLSADPAILIQKLSADLDKAPLNLGVRPFDLGLAGGVIRMAPAGPQASTDDVQVRTGASLDLRNLTLDAEVRIALAKAPRDWGDSPLPQLRLNWLGPWLAPKRSLDARTLMSGLTARALVIETTRLDALDADARERAFFNRRLRGLQYLKQRERELANFAAEQTALAERERARRAAAAAAAVNATPPPSNAQIIPVPASPVQRAPDPLLPQPIIPWPVR